MFGTKRTTLCAVLLLVTIAAGRAQNCPNLFSSVASDVREAVVRDCTGSINCDACQCSLMKAVTPDLIKSGKILESEAWMGSALTTISDSLTACKKQFAVQLLENTNTTISELSSFDTCSTDVTAISKCLSAQRVAAPAPASAPASGNSMAGEVLSEACAASVSGSSNATDCPSPAAARVVAGVPISSGGDVIFAPFDETSVLKISADNTRGRITWRANCWCDDNWDPVCDADTRKQYPNACSAQCQSVAKVVPCTALEPLVNQTMAGNTPVYVIDQALGANPSTTAYDGPVPAEPSEDSQNFYYYYEEHVDDTQDALDIASTLAEAFLAARLGEEAESVEAVAKTIPAAVQAGVGAKPATNVTAADGPADAPAGPFAGLRNITITRQRFGVPDRRNVSVSVATGLGDMPASPAWMNTNAPGYTANVYKRDADRTSRIIASLMAAAQETKAATQPRAAANLTRVAGVAADALGAVADSNTTAGGMLRTAGSALGNITARVNETVTDVTSSLGDMMTNATANGTGPAGPVIAAFQGLAQNPPARGTSRFGGLLEQLRGMIRREAEARQGRVEGLRSALNMNGTMDMNGTMGVNATMNSTMNGTDADADGVVDRPLVVATSRRPKRRFMFF